MPRAMKTAGALAALILVVAGCKSGGLSRTNDAAVMQAPVAATGSGIDPDPAVVDDLASKGVTDGRTTGAGSGAALLKADGMQVKEVVVDPKDPKTKIELLRHILGTDWILAGKNDKSNGTIVYTFMRRDVFRVETDPFGLPDISGPKDENGKPKLK
jgi:hypothetical protein